MKRPTRSQVHAGARFLTVGAAAAAVAVLVPTLTWSADLGPSVREPAAIERIPVTLAGLTCTGPELVGLTGAKDVRGPGTVAVAAPPVTGSAADSTLSIGATREDVDGRGTVLRAALSGADPIDLQGTGVAAPGLVGAQSWTADSAEARGLVSAACGPAETDVWLLGGGSEAGRQERIVLANPGANEVVADVVVHGAKGEVVSATGRGVVVPPHGRTSVLLDAIAGGESRPAVHVSTTGGAVRATLTDLWIDGAVPAGIDSSTPSAPPALLQVVPGVLVPPKGQGSATVRVANPGDQPAVVSLRALTATGGRPIDKGVRTIAPGAVADVELGSVAGSSVAVEVRSDAPVVAAGRSLVRRGDGRGDFAWTAAATTVHGLSGTTLADVSGRTVVLSLVASSGAAKVEVVRVEQDGTARTSPVDLRADAQTEVDVSGAQAVWVRTVSGQGEVRAATRTQAGSGAARVLTSTALEAAPVDAPAQRIIPLP